jgi:glycosyltransferase involved in cell wall biosynthesis
MLPGKFSAVIPVYNSRTHLKACLDSVMAAALSYGTAEVIVLDNGSTDGSYEILEHDYKQARICRFPDLTIAALRNRGAELAEGEYLSFIDSDCVIPVDYFDEALKLFNSVEAAATGSMCLLPDSATWIEKDWNALHVRRREGYVNYLNSGNLVIKAAAFAQVGGFDASLVTAEDADLGARLRQAGLKIYECHNVWSIHLGIPRTLGQFIRRQAWYGQGMLGYLHLWKPVTTILMYFVFIVVGLLNFYFTPRPFMVRLAIFLLLVNLIPAAAVTYRLRRMRQIISPLPSLFLYHCFYVGRLCGLAKVLMGEAARTYRKDG